VSHTAESVFQMAFEEIYSSDASTWHLQFHGNANPTLACQDVGVFLSNGVEAAPAALYTLKENIEAASCAAAAGGPVLMIDVYDNANDCTLRGTDNIQMRFASGLPHASICAHGNVPVGGGGRPSPGDKRLALQRATWQRLMSGGSERAGERYVGVVERLAAGELRAPTCRCSSRRWRLLSSSRRAGNRRTGGPRRGCRRSHAGSQYTAGP
jgi:hypothetical protein